MNALILKDIYLLKNYGRFLILAAIMMIVIGSVLGDGITYAKMFVSMGLLLPFISNFSYDSMVGWDEFEVSLPIRKSAIAMSKYVEIGIIFIASAALSLVNAVSVISLYVPCTMLLLLSIWVPVIYKLGAEKGRVVFMIMIGLAVFLAVIGSDITGNNLIVTSITGLGSATFSIIFFTATAVGFVLSYVITLRILKSKEY